MSSSCKFSVSASSVEVSKAMSSEALSGEIIAAFLPISLFAAVTNIALISSSVKCGVEHFSSPSYL